MNIEKKTGKPNKPIYLKRGKPLAVFILPIAILLSPAVQSSAAQTVPSTPRTAETQSNPAQTTVLPSAQITLTSAQFVGQTGSTVEQLIESAFKNRGSLLAARQRLAVLEGRRIQAGLRPNPVLESEYGTPRFLGGEAESEFSVGVSQTFELGGKRQKRVAVADLELQQTRAEIAALERSAAIEIRQAYARAISAGRQLDVLERLLAADADLVRATEARLKEGDVAPLDLNLVRVENDRLRVQAIERRSELETALLDIKTLAGFVVDQPLTIVPQSDRPPRLDLSLAELTELALNSRADLQAARIGEQLGTARIDLARSQAVPNVAASVRYSNQKQIIDFPAAIGGNTVNRDNSLAFGVSVEIPVFNRNQGEIASVVGERTQATRIREFLENTVKRDVAVSYRKYRAAAEKLVLYSTQILPRSEENVRSVRAAYNFGEFSVFEVVNEQRRLTENVTGYNDALRDYYQSLSELENALGTNIPATAFAPVTTSILPEQTIVPNQADGQKFLQKLETPTTEKDLSTTRKLNAKNRENK